MHFMNLSLFSVIENLGLKHDQGTQPTAVDNACGRLLPGRPNDTESDAQSLLRLASSSSAASLRPESTMGIKKQPKTLAKTPHSVDLNRKETNAYKPPKTLQASLDYSSPK